MQITLGNLYSPFHVTSARDLTPAHNLTPARDPNPWLLHVIIVQLNSICGVEWIEHLFTILPKAQLL